MFKTASGVLWYKFWIFWLTDISGTSEPTFSSSHHRSHAGAKRTIKGGVANPNTGDSTSTHQYGGGSTRICTGISIGYAPPPVCSTPRPAASSPDRPRSFSHAVSCLQLLRHRQRFPRADCRRDALLRARGARRYGEHVFVPHPSPSAHIAQRPDDRPCAGSLGRALSRL